MLVISPGICSFKNIPIRFCRVDEQFQIRKKEAKKKEKKRKGKKLVIMTGSISKRRQEEALTPFLELRMIEISFSQSSASAASLPLSRDKISTETGTLISMFPFSSFTPIAALRSGSKCTAVSWSRAKKKKKRGR
jgi:hypothetical protein